MLIFTTTLQFYLLIIVSMHLSVIISRTPTIHAKQVCETICHATREQPMKIITRKHIAVPRVLPEQHACDRGCR